MAADINVKIALDGERDYRQALKNCNDSLKNADSALKAFDETAKGNEKSVENLQKRQELLSAALDEAKKKQETLTSIVDKAKAARDKAAEAVEKARKEEGENSEAVKKAEKQYSSAQNAVDRYETQLNKANEQVAKYTNEMNGATEETSDFQKVVGNTAAMEALTKIADKVSGAMSKVNQAMKDASKEVETGLKQINKRTGASGAELEKYQQIARDVFTSIPTSIDTASDAVGELATRFKDLTDDQLANLTTAFVKFADLNETDVATAVDSTQKAMAAFGVEIDDAGQLLDVFNRTGQNTGTNAADLASKLTQNAEAFQQMGMDVYQATEFLGRLEVSGADSSAVMQGLKKALKEASDQGKPLNEVLAEMQENVLDGTEGMDGLNYAYEVFGTRSGAQVYNAVKNGTIDFKDLAETTDILTDAQNNLNDTYDNSLTVYDKYQVAQNNLTDAAEELQGEMNNALAPAVDAVSGVIKDLTDGFKKLPPKVQTAIGLFATIGGKAAEVAPQIMSLVTQITTLKIAKTAAGNTDSLKTSLGNLAGKAGLVSGVIAAIGAGVAYMSSEMDKATASSKALKEAVTGTKDGYEETKASVADLDKALAQASSTEEKIAIVQGLLSEAQDAAATSTAQHSQAVDELNKVQDVQTSTTAKLIGAFGGMNADIVAQVKALANSSEAWKDSDEVMNDSAETTSYLQGVLDDLIAQQEEEAKQADETADAYDEYGNKVKRAADKTEKAQGRISSGAKIMMEKTQSAIGSMKDALKNATDSITNWFDEVAEKEELSADTLYENLDAQIQAMQDWQKNLSYLADKGINQDLLQYLADMGPKGAAYVQAFVNAANGETEHGIEDMNALWLEKLNLDGGYNANAQKLISAVGEANARIQTETAKAAQGAYDAAAQIPLSERDAIAAYTNRPVEAVKDLNNNMNRALQNSDSYGNGYNIGANMVSGIVKGINNNASSAINAAAAMANRTISKTKAIMAIASPSKVFEEIGMYLDQGLAKGINKYAYAPDMAMTDTMKDLVQMPDLSRYDSASAINNQVAVYIGDKELTAIMAAGVVKNISSNQRAQYVASGGR